MTRAGVLAEDLFSLRLRLDIVVVVKKDIAGESRNHGKKSKRDEVHFFTSAGRRLESASTTFSSFSTRARRAAFSAEQESLLAWIWACCSWIASTTGAIMLP